MANPDISSSPSTGKTILEWFFVTALTIWKWNYLVMGAIVLLRGWFDTAVNGLFTGIYSYIRGARASGGCRLYVSPSISSIVI